MGKRTFVIVLFRLIAFCLLSVSGMSSSSAQNAMFSGDILRDPRGVECLKRACKGPRAAYSLRVEACQREHNGIRTGLDWFDEPVSVEVVTCQWKDDGDEVQVIQESVLGLRQVVQLKKNAVVALIETCQHAGKSPGVSEKSLPVVERTKAQDWKNLRALQAEELGLQRQNIWYDEERGRLEAACKIETTTAVAATSSTSLEGGADKVAPDTKKSAGDKKSKTSTANVKATSSTRKKVAEAKSTAPRGQTSKAPVGDTCHPAAFEVRGARQGDWLELYVHADPEANMKTLERSCYAKDYDLSPAKIILDNEGKDTIPYFVSEGNEKFSWERAEPRRKNMGKPGGMGYNDPPDRAFVEQHGSNVRLAFQAKQVIRLHKKGVTTPPPSATPKPLALNPVAADRSTVSIETLPKAPDPAPLTPAVIALGSSVAPPPAPPAEEPPPASSAVVSGPLPAGSTQVSALSMDSTRVEEPTARSFVEQNFLRILGGMAFVMFALVMFSRRGAKSPDELLREKAASLKTGSGEIAPVSQPPPSLPPTQQAPPRLLPPASGEKLKGLPTLIIEDKAETEVKKGRF
jgi:hypothetical protein